ncbi:HNH endonuclease [Roseomonas sp. 1311]|uniref:HNH endonuclease n=2 Tax=Roseomonas marmotae TaxID=2768161 RepID=A0ABS3KIK4_9PROT|nr:HNH endonuclease [Roseomonas marmotae]
MIDRKTYRFHDLVAAAFLPEPPQSDCVIGFRNGNPSDCSAENLYWLPCPYIPSNSNPTDDHQHSFV